MMNDFTLTALVTKAVDELTEQDLLYLAMTASQAIYFAQRPLTKIELIGKMRDKVDRSRKRIESQLDDQALIKPEAVEQGIKYAINLRLIERRNELYHDKVGD